MNGGKTQLDLSHQKYRIIKYQGEYITTLKIFKERNQRTTQRKIKENCQIGEQVNKASINENYNY